MTMAFKRATRHAVHLKIGISGPSGSGKTDGALAFAQGFLRVTKPGGRIALIDTEHGSASLYADKYEFDTLDLAAPFTSARYIEAMQAAVEAGYDFLIIDTVSHQWFGQGGILSRKEELDRRPGSNSYTNWAIFTKEHQGFVETLLHLPIHVIVTLRAKQDYILETNDRGKQQPKKVGLAPIQRDGMEYEFSAMFELQMDHRASASKDRTELFDGRLIDLRDPAESRRLGEWLASGRELKPVAASSGATADQLARLNALAADSRVSADVAATIQHGVATGLTAEKAARWIAQLEEKLGDVAVDETSATGATAGDGAFDEVDVLDPDLGAGERERPAAPPPAPAAAPKRDPRGAQAKLGAALARDVTRPAGGPLTSTPTPAPISVPPTPPVSAVRTTPDRGEVRASQSGALMNGAARMSDPYADMEADAARRREGRRA